MKDDSGLLGNGGTVEIDERRAEGIEDLVRAKLGAAGEGHGWRRFYYGDSGRKPGRWRAASRDKLCACLDVRRSGYDHPLPPRHVPVFWNERVGEGEPLSLLEDPM